MSNSGTPEVKVIGTADFTQEEQAFAKFHQAIGVTDTKLKEIGGAAAIAGSRATDGVAGFDKFGNKITENQTAFRGWIKEQRLQDRAIRESSQSIMALVMGLSFLSQGNEGAGSTQKDLTRAIMAGVVAQQSAEFAFFGLGRAGESLGGEFGSLLTIVSKYGGSISAVLGLAAGLFAFFDRQKEKLAQVNVELEKSNRLFEAYGAELRQRETEAAGYSQNRINSEIRQRSLTLESINAKRTALDTEVETGKVTEDRYKVIESSRKLLDQQKKDEESFLMVLLKESEARRVAHELTVQNAGQIKTIHEVETAIAAVKHVSERATGKELENYKQLLVYLEKRKSTLESTPKESLIDGIDRQKLKSTPKESLIDGIDRQKLIADQNEYFSILDKTNERLAVDEYARRIQQENRIHQQVMVDLDAAKEKGLADDEDVANERAAHEKQLSVIKSDKAAKELDNERKRFNEFNTSFRKITSILGTGLGDSGSKFLDDLTNAIDLVTEIKKILESINAAGSLFSFLGSIFGMAAGVAAGGPAAPFIGAGGAVVPGTSRRNINSLTAARDNILNMTAAMNPHVTVVLVGTMDGQKFQRKTLPEALKFQRKKIV